MSRDHAGRRRADQGGDTARPTRLSGPAAQPPLPAPPGWYITVESEVRELGVSMEITSKRWSADASSGALPGRRRASQAGPAVSYDGNSQRKLNIHTRTPHSDTIIIKCNGPCIGTSMHMPTRGRRCLGLLGGHPPLPGHRHPPPGRWGSPPPHQPALGRPSGSPARPDRRAPPPQREVEGQNRRPKRRRCRSLPAPRTPANVRDRWICIRRRGSELGRVGGVVGRKRCKHGSARPRTHKHAPPLAHRHPRMHEHTHARLRLRSAARRP